MHSVVASSWVVHIARKSYALSSHASVYYPVFRILAEEGLASCASSTATIYTPTGDSFTGLLPAERVCAVSIIRAGDSLLDAVIACDPSVSVGKLLVRCHEIEFVQ
jgi:uracil phosphoribosyltransferase